MKKEIKEEVMNLLASGKSTLEVYRILVNKYGAAETDAMIETVIDQNISMLCRTQKQSYQNIPA